MNPAPHSPGRAAKRVRAAAPLLGAPVLGVFLLAAPLGAQEVPAAPAPDSTAVVRSSTSPRGAFLRAVAVPGWGHASIGAYHRGAFYFVVQGASAWMLLRTRHHFSEVEARLAWRSDVLRSDLIAAGADEATILKQLEADAGLQDLRNLKEARRQQREDWTAVTVFLALLSGVDAYVSAHLGDFPAPLSVEAQPLGNGRVEVSVGISLPR